MTDGHSGGRPRSPAAPHGLARVLGRADLVLFTVCAILTIDTLASSAAMGLAWFSWWVITMTVFFIPYGLITAELGSAWPGEGGVYIWVREAFGPRWGSTAAWLYWINNAYLDPVGLPDLRRHVRPDLPEDALALAGSRHRDRPDLADGRRRHRASRGLEVAAEHRRGRQGAHLPRARRSRPVGALSRAAAGQRLLAVEASFRGGTTRSRTFRLSSTRPSASSS